MSIVTKKGDSGETGLLGGRRVGKDDIRFQAIGMADELNSALGILRSLELPAEIDEELIQIQAACFVVGSTLAAINEAGGLVQAVPSLNDDLIPMLEQRITKLEAELPIQRRFILPAGTQTAATAFWARAVCRRAERTLVAANRQYPLPSLILRFLNRLSDYLFILGRYFNYQAKVNESEWNSG